MNSPLPAGVATTRRDVRLRLRRQRERRRQRRSASTSRSSGARRTRSSARTAAPPRPIACQATTTVLPTSTPLPEVTTSDIANDLRIKVYGQRTQPPARCASTARSSPAPRPSRRSRSTRRPTPTPPTRRPRRRRGRSPPPTPSLYQTSEQLADRLQRDALPDGHVPGLPAGVRDGHLGAARPHLPPEHRRADRLLTTSTSCRARRCSRPTAAPPSRSARPARRTRRTRSRLPALNTAARVNGAIIRMYVRTTNGRTQPARPVPARRGVLR